MEEVLVAVTGPDSFGVVFSTAEALSKLGCAFIDMNQTTVRNQFSSIMIVTNPQGLSTREVEDHVHKALCLHGFDMSVLVRTYHASEATITKGEPFVITVDGSDSKGILLSFTRIFNDSKINIDSFRSIEETTDDVGQRLPTSKVLLVFEVTVPFDVDRKALHKTLSSISKDHGLSMSMQHRKIFEEVHRVNVA